MPPSNTNGKRILIVDDELSIVKYLEALLQDHGYETVTAMNGEEAMERVKSSAPDLVCLDITMPRKSGVRFYRELREQPEYASVKVVVVTAVTGKGGDPEPFRHFLETRKQVPPPEEFISKPIDRDSFLETIAKVLAA